jgi:hypothetical protein
MRILITAVIAVALLSPAQAKIGWTLQQCISEYGPVVEKYGDDNTSLPEYEFLKDGIDVTVSMIDDRVAQITISPAKPFSDAQIVEALKHYSGKADWEQRPATEKETTDKFSGFTADGKTHRYYRTADKSLYGFVKTDWVGSRPFFVKITIPEHKERLQRYRDERKK